MPSRIVQFRAPDEQVRVVTRHGLEPNEAARDAFQRLVQFLLFEESMEWSRKHPVKAPFGAAKAVRESRKELEDRR